MLFCRTVPSRKESSLQKVNDITGSNASGKCIGAEMLHSNDNKHENTNKTTSEINQQYFNK
jgi:hypothetical protein